MPAKSTTPGGHLFILQASIAQPAGRWRCSRRHDADQRHNQPRRRRCRWKPFNIGNGLLRLCSKAIAETMSTTAPRQRQRSTALPNHQSGRPSDSTATSAIPGSQQKVIKCFFSKLLRSLAGSFQGDHARPATTSAGPVQRVQSPPLVNLQQFGGKTERRQRDRQRVEPVATDGSSARSRLAGGPRSLHE